MKRLLLAIGLLVVPACSFAQGAPPFTLEGIMNSPFPTELVAAPAGSRVAWVFYQEGRRNIWVAEGPAFSARQLTRYSSDDGQEISDVQFSAEGASIVYVRGGNKNSAGEVPNPTSETDGVNQSVWVVPFAAGAPRRIDAGRSPVVSSRGWVAYVKDNKIWIAPLSGIAKPRQIVARGSNSSPAWSPDGRKLAFASSRPSHGFIVVYDSAIRKLTYMAASVDRDSAPRWSPDSKWVAFVRRPAQPVGGTPGSPLTTQDEPNPWSIWVADASTGAGRPAWQSGTTENDSLPNMAGGGLLNFAAGNQIVFASEMDGWQHLYSIPPTGGTPALLTPGECEYEHVAFTPDRKHVVYSSNCGDIDRRHLWRVSVTGGAPELLTPGEANEWAPVMTADGKWIFYVRSDARQPAMPFVRATAETGPGRMLAPQTLAKDFPSAKIVPPQQVIFEAADGWKIHGQLFVPAGSKSGDARPAVIFMHGGPIRQMLLGWNHRGYYHNAYALNQYLVSRGYIVLSVNYRSGIGYGRAFRMAPGRGSRGASEYQDIVAGGKYLQARPDVDPKRIGLWGGSYGGYLTALGLARDSDLFAAGVDLHGVHDWSVRGLLSGPTSERQRVAREASPVASVKSWRSPVLLIHGDDDRNVNFDQTVDLAARLRQQGVEFEQIIFPDEVHSFLLHRHWMEVFHAAARFFDRHLKATP